MSKSQLWKELKELYTQANTQANQRLQYQRATIAQMKQVIESLQVMRSRTISRQLQDTKGAITRQIVEARDLVGGQNPLYVRLRNTVTTIEDSFLIQPEWKRSDIYHAVMQSPAVPYDKEDKKMEQIDVKTYTLVRVLRQSNVRPQRYRDGEENCLITPIIIKLQDKLDTTKMALSTTKRYKTTIKKLKGYQQKHKETGLSTEDIQQVCNDITVDIKIYDILGQGIEHIKSTKKAQYSFQFINTRSNHVDEYYNISGVQNEVVLSHNDFKELEAKLEDQSYAYDLSKGAKSKIYSKGICYIDKTVQDMNQLIKQFKGTVKDIYNRYTENQIEYLSNFITFNSVLLLGKVPDSKDDLIHIDQETAYANFKVCDYYRRFPNITDIRRVPMDYKFALQNIGLYQCIVSMPSTKKNEYLFKIYNFKEDEQYLTSPEIEFLADRGAKIKLLSGAYGKETIDFEFPEYMKEKKDYLGGQIRPFCKFTGQLLRTEIHKVSHKYIHTADDYLLQYVGDRDDQTIYRIGDTKDYDVRYYQPRDTFKSGLPIACFIIAYQRLNMCQQLEQMDFSKVYRLVTDAIYTYEKDAKLRPSFRLKPVECISTSSAEKYITRPYKYECTLPDYRESANIELHKGVGGGGKTHQQLIDKGLVNPCYVGHSNKLATSKRRTYTQIKSCKFTNYTVVMLDRFRDKYQSRNIILDEISMVSSNTIKAIQQKYPLARIICCGDDCQLMQTSYSTGNPFTDVQYQLVKEYNTQYRCKDDKLKVLQQRIRQMRVCGYTEREQLEVVKQHIEQINIEQLQQQYSSQQMILVSTHIERHRINGLIKQTDYKYRVNKKTKIEEVQYYNGDIIISDKPIQNSNLELTTAFTVHSIQGETFKDKIYINEGDFEWAPGYIYTAITRAEYLNQIVLIEQDRNVNLLI